MKNILVLTDFSKASLHAAGYARLVYEKLGAQKIVLYHSYQTAADTDEVLPDDAPSNEWRQTMLARLSGIRDDIAGQAGNNIQIDILVDYVALEENINSLCEQNNINLIVMGAKGTGDDAEKSLGSTTTVIINAAQYPVMIVPQSATFEPVKAVILTSDLQKIAAPVEEKIGLLLEKLNAKLFVLNVDRKEKEFGPETSFELRQLHYVFDKYDPEFIFTEDADTAEGVERVASEKNASLIVTIHRKHGWLYHLLHGSVSAKLALHTGTVLLSLYSE